MPSQTKKITIDTAALLFGRTVGLLLGIVRLNYLATYLGLTNFGILNFASYFTSLFQWLFDLGLSTLLTREIARNPAQSRSILGQVLTLNLVTAAVGSAVIAVAVIMSQIGSASLLAVLLTTIALAINSMSLTFLAAFQAHRKIFVVSAASILNDLLLSLSIIVILPNSPTVPTALVLTIGIAVVYVVTLVAVYTRRVGSVHVGVNLGTWRRLLIEGAPIAVSALGISLYTFVGPTLLRYTRGDTEVGIYSAGYKLISILTLIPVTFTQVVYPVFAEFHTHAPAKLGKALRDSTRVMSEISIPLAVGTILLAPDIIHLLYPASFAPATRVLQVMIAGNAMGYLAWIIQTYLLALNRQRLCMWNALAVAASVCILTYWLVPQYGYLFVAIIFMATEFCLFGSLALITYRIGYPPVDLRQVLRVVAAAAVMGGAAFALKEVSLALAVVGGIGVYVVMLFFLRVFGEQEKEILAKLVER
jgi:O-antigen/teichoic acid export membrane protein